MNTLRKNLRAATVIVVALMLASTKSVAAHAGHSHADEGMDVSTMLSVAGVVLALGVAWRMTSRLSHAEVPGEDEKPASD